MNQQTEIIKESLNAAIIENSPDNEKHENFLLKTENNTNYTRFSNKMKEFLENKKFADVAIKIGDKQVLGHKLILADKSSVLRKTLLEDSQLKLLDLTDSEVDFSAFEVMMDFLYGKELDEVTLNKHLNALLSSAKKLDCAELLEYCEEYLMKSADSDTILDSLQVADTYKLEHLLQKLLHKFNENPKEVVESPRFKKFSMAHPDLFNKIFKFWIQKNLQHLITMTKAPDTQPVSERFEPQNEFTTNFAKIFEDDKFSDVSFVIGDTEIKAHKIILLANSTYFEAMFGHGTVEINATKIHVTGIEPSVFKELLRYIYCKRVNDLKKCALGLFQAADMYNLLKLKEICAEYLCDNLTNENVLEVYHFGKLHNHDKLMEKTDDFIKSYITGVVQNPGWDEFAAIKQSFVIEIFLEKINFVALKTKNAAEPQQSIVFGSIPKFEFVFTSSTAARTQSGSTNTDHIIATQPKRLTRMEGYYRRSHPRYQ